MAEYEQTLRDIESLLDNIDRRIDAQHVADNAERLLRWRRELVLERADLLNLQRNA